MERFEMNPNAYDEDVHEVMDKENIPRSDREPFELPKLVCKDEYWYLKDHDISFSDKIKEFKSEWFRLKNYQSHAKIKMPLNN